VPDVFLLDPRHEAFLAGTGPGPLPEKNTRVMVGFAFVFALFGAPMLSLTVHDARQQILLDRAGAPAIAQVLAKREDDSDDATSYLVRYRFRAPGGQPVEAERSVRRRTYRHLQPGDRLAIHYLPGEPGVSRVDEPGAGRQVLWAGGFMAAWMAAVLGLNAWAWPPFLRDRRLRRGCRILRGRVVAAGGQRDGDGDFNLQLDYAFDSPEGRALGGRIRAVREDLADARPPAPGTPLAIAYADERTFRPL
jgi:hypothetical protein